MIFREEKSNLFFIKIPQLFQLFYYWRDFFIGFEALVYWRERFKRKDVYIFIIDIFNIIQ